MDARLTWKAGDVADRVVFIGDADHHVVCQCSNPQIASQIAREHNAFAELVAALEMAQDIIADGTLDEVRRSAVLRICEAAQKKASL